MYSFPELQLLCIYYCNFNATVSFHSSEPHKALLPRNPIGAANLMLLHFFSISSTEVNVRAGVTQCALCSACRSGSTYMCSTVTVKAVSRKEKLTFFFKNDFYVLPYHTIFISVGSNNYPLLYWLWLHIWQHKMSNLYRVYDAYSYAICQHEYVSESVHCSCPLWL